MNIAIHTARPPQLVQALEALALRADNQDAADTLFHELSGITVLVAKKFTNDRTADGMLEAFHLTIGCISLAISQAGIADSNEARLSFLLRHGAEYVFQMGFRHIKELSALPYVAYVSDFDNDAFIQQRNLKAIFMEICSADPSRHGQAMRSIKMNCRTGSATRRSSIAQNGCARIIPTVLSKTPSLMPMPLSLLPSSLQFQAMAESSRAPDRREIETLINRARESQPDVEANWNEFLKKIPPEFQPLLHERMEELRGTIIKKILGKTRIKTVLTELQDHYAGSEQDIDYS